jgi:hypothetical protein
VTLAPDEWLVRLTSWIIQDGNVRDLAVGDTVERALTFHTSGLSPAENRSPSARRHGADYEIVGELSRKWRIWILDFGLCAYSEDLAWKDRARQVSGLIGLEFDPFPFADTYRHLPRMPQMSYLWTVTGLWSLRDVGNTIGTGRDLELDALPGTNAVTDDGVYLVRCRRG